jgi:STE24 endopeptidase
MNTFTYLFLLALAASLGVRFWLAARHIAHVRKHRETVPDSFAGRVPLEDHHKAADYTLTNTRVGRIALLYDSLLLLGWTLGGGLEWLDNSWRAAELQPVVTGIAVMFSAVLIMTVLDLPFSLYHTFVVEERFGFNRSTPAVFVTDLLKNALLLVIIGGPLIALALWIMEASGGLWWLYVWAVWTVFSLVMFWA